MHEILNFASKVRFFGWTLTAIGTDFIVRITLNFWVEFSGGKGGTVEPLYFQGYQGNIQFLILSGKGGNLVHVPLLSTFDAHCQSDEID